MIIYFILIASILIFSAIVTNSNNEESKQEKIIAKFGTIAIFLVLALKKYTVGIDIAGYQRDYLRSAYKTWEDVDYIYFEKGYIQLSKLFAKNEVDFQHFMMFVYAFLCIALYFFIKKYSKNATLSLLIFICFQFFVFSISGVRQTIAMAICMLSFTIFERNNKWRIAIALLLNFSATYFHKSAWIFFAVYMILFLFKGKNINIVWYVAASIISFVLRPFILRFIEQWFGSDMTESSVTLGGAFIFLIGITVFMWVVLHLMTNKMKIDVPEIYYDFTRILLFSIPAYIVLSGSSLLRAFMYLNLFMIPGIPNIIKLLEKKTERIIFNTLMGAFLIILFYVDTLKPNQLQLCPYLFYWQ